MLLRRALSTKPSVLFVGLGNPVPQYAGTRHNVGQWVLHKVVTEAWPHFGPMASFTPQAVAASHVAADGQRVTVANTSKTYMNVLGPAVAQLWAKFKKQCLQDPYMVVLHDELQLPLGTIKVRRQGTSARGHNGLRSIDLTLGQRYTKIGIGIGKPTKGRVDEHVLSRFSRQEESEVEKVCFEVVEVMEKMISGEYIKEVFKGE